MKVANSIYELIGNTPMIKLNRLVEKDSADVYLKLESFNPGSSVKDRIALNMIERAEESGLLKEGSTIVEPTSGNTGIGLAMIAAAKGYKCILTMPETMSIERRKLLAAYGSEIVLTPGQLGMKGAIQKAEELSAANGYFMPQQFKNPANPEIHRKTTAVEILDQLDNKIDAFVAGVGTGGTLTGVGEVLKQKIDGVKIIAVEPAKSPVISGGKPGPHGLQGIGAGFIPDTLNKDIIDKVEPIYEDLAFDIARKLASKEGILVGISSGAAVAAALKVAKELGIGKNVVALTPDTGERYLSTALFNYEEK